MNMSKPRIALLSIVAMTFSATAAAEEVADHLRSRWFEIEIIVFERLPVLDINSSEQLTQTAPRSWPHNLTELITGGTDLRTGPFPDDGSEQCLGYPQLPQREPLRRSDRDERLKNVRDWPPVEDRTALSNEQTMASVESDALVGQTPVGATTSPESLAYEQVRRDIAAYEQTLINRALVLSDGLTLTDQVKTLNRQRHLRPLLHQRWLMPVPPRENPASLYLATANTPAAPATRMGQAKVEGFIELSVGRYLHLAPTLWYHADNLGLAPLSLPVLPLQFRAVDAYRELREVDSAYMVLHQSRRMRSEELHYIDHPKIGMLVRIDPVAPPAALQAQLEAAVEGRSAANQGQ